MARKTMKKRTNTSTHTLNNKKTKKSKPSLTIEKDVVTDMRLVENEEQLKETYAEVTATVLMEKDPIEQMTEKVENSPKVKVLITASEGMPFVVTGGLGEVVGSLPKAIMQENSREFDVRVVLPLYESISHEERRQMEFLGYFNVAVAWREQYCGVFKTVRNGVTYYFIDNEYYFKRANAYGYYDDGERFAFFSKAVLDSIHLMDFQPDIIHAHDWQTALVPVYLHYYYGYLGAKSIFTIHNIEYQGQGNLNMISDVFGLPKEAGAILEYDGCVNLLKAAIECSNQVNTVSPTYALELRDNYFAKGLAAIIQKNDWKMRGILNGIDIESYNPDTDPALFVNYNVDTIYKKKANKAEVQRLVNLPVEENTPVIAIISRLVSHKGLDLVTEMLEQLLNERVQVIVLGIGDRKYEDYFKYIQNKYPEKVASLLCFNHDLARKIYAGSDFFLMPSKSEPCGLAQMIASRYGTVPIVRATGGLRDTISDCTIGVGNGFVFEDYNANELLHAIYRGLHVYHNQEDWNQLVRWIMTLDFSWQKSAREYEQLYVNLCPIHAYC